MIPTFPNFKKIELTDKKDVEKFTSKFPPYSDFNFINMWAWDIKNEMRISTLNDNLVVRFTDYITGENFYSFLGKNKANETVEKLLEFSKKKNLKPILKFIPEEVINNLIGIDFHTLLNRDEYDYIYSISHLAHMNNWTKHSSGKNIRSFIKKFPHYIVKHTSIKEIKKNEYIEMFKKWVENKDIEDYLKLNEYEALERIFKTNQDNLKVVSIYINDVLVGFTIHETLSSDYAISHFAKVNKNHHRSIGDILNWEEAKILDTRGVKYINWEQDLGISGLRKSKEKYKPSFFLKKFTIGRK